MCKVHQASKLEIGLKLGGFHVEPTKLLPQFNPLTRQYSTNNIYRAILPVHTHLSSLSAHYSFPTEYLEEPIRQIILCLFSYATPSSTGCLE